MKSEKIVNILLFITICFYMYYNYIYIKSFKIKLTKERATMIYFEFYL